VSGPSTPRLSLRLLPTPPVKAGGAGASPPRHLTDVEIVEITMASALFNMINRLNDSFRTELEPEEYNRRQHHAVGVTAPALDEYACRICQAMA
jgi:hypothetical protein